MGWEFEPVVSRSDVEMAYRLILGREPDTETSTQGHIEGHESVDALRETFFRSEEFRTRVMPGIPAAGKPLHWPAPRVDTQVSDSQLAEMIGRVEKNFQHMGETEPHWSVLSSDRYKADNIANTEAEFFASGKGVVDEFRIAASRAGVDLTRVSSVMELGCGVGRSTIWLAEKFSTIIAVDASAPHLDLAARAAETFGRRNITFCHVNTISGLDALPNFDAFFSIIVLQHNPPPLICHMLRKILGKLNPGGVAYFQIPTYGNGYSFDADQYLRTPVQLGVPEMHAVPQHALFRLVVEAGCGLLELREDDAAGASFVSNRLLVQRSGTATPTSYSLGVSNISQMPTAR